MIRNIRILFATVLAAIFLFPADGKTIPADYPAVEPYKKQNHPKVSLIDSIFGNLTDQKFDFVLTYDIIFLISISWKYLLIQISEPTKGKSRQLAGTHAQAGIAIGQAIFCKGQSQAQAGTSTNQGQAAAPNQGQAAAPNQGQAAAIAQARTFGDLEGLGKALFC